MMLKGLVIPTAVVLVAASVTLAIGPQSPERTQIGRAHV